MKRNHYHVTHVNQHQSATEAEIGEEPIIRVKHVTKYFRSYLREKGLTGFVKNLFLRKYKIIRAIDDVSFCIERGEIVGLIGPNGAGKSTLLKMLCGILVPNKGFIEVLGTIPHKKRKRNAQNISVVFGQRTQLWWDLPVIESYEILKKIYNIPDGVYGENLVNLSEMVEFTSFLHTPVRELSLGNRVKADLIAAFLHNPKIIVF